MKERRQRISDVRVLAALSHPVRVQILNYLLGVGPRTASQCAEVVDATPSSCSYHLRHLESFGLVERVEDADGDGRERPWRAAATGFTFGERPSRDTPALRAARDAVGLAGLEHAHRLAVRYGERAPTFPSDWQDAAEFVTYGLLVTPAELRRIAKAVDAAIRPYIAATREAVPEGAEPVHVTFQAFRRVD